MEQVSTFSGTECHTRVPVQNTKTGTYSHDMTDFAPRTFSVSNLDIVFLVGSLLFHALDVFTDINVAYRHYDAKEYVFFYCTIAVVLIPSFINSLVSWHMLWDSLVYAIKCRCAEKRGEKQDQEKFYRLMLKEDADSALLRIFEFLESAPQQVIQLSGLLLGQALKTSVYHVIFSIVSSFVSMALTLMSYQRSIRFAQEDKANITATGSFTIFIWQLMMATSRIVALSALSSVCWPATIILVSVHWILMLLMLSCCEQVNFCSGNITKPKWQHHLGDFLFDASLSLAYIFLYISPGDGATRSRYAVFYTVIGFENIGAVLVWTHLIGPEVTYMWYYYVVLVAVIGCFFAGIAAMIVYYTCTRNKKAPPKASEQSGNPNEDFNNLQQLQTAL